MVKALDHAADNRVYNLASDTTVTIRELAETVQELVGDVDIVYTPGRNGDFDGAEISSRRAERELGWRASTPLREGVSRYMTWLASDTPPEPVAAPEPEVAPQPVAAPERVPARGRRSLTPSLGWPSGVFGDGPTVAFACAIATVITYFIALRTRSLDDAQTHAVGLTTVVCTLGGLMLLQSASVRRMRMGITWALWLVALYVGLDDPALDEAEVRTRGAGGPHPGPERVRGADRARGGVGHHEVAARVDCLGRGPLRLVGTSPAASILLSTSGSAAAVARQDSRAL